MPPPLPTPKPSPKKGKGWVLRAILGLPTLVFIGLALTAAWWLSTLRAEPTDADMIKNFQAHRQEFEILRTIVVHDKGLLRVDKDWTTPENTASIGVSRDRIREYRAIFKTLGIPRGFMAQEDQNDVDFFAYCYGMLNSSISKSYAWRPSPPEKVAASLEGLPANDRDDVYRHIEGNWYLHYEH